ncbi:MAG: phosphate acyltransferase, partial [Proteobacteria bacterium]|nr:phosphate acyltransferase [Pseudomonadota bacterium]
MTTNEIKLAIDAMGGDDAPQSVISGTALAMQNDPALRPILVGDENKLKPLIKDNPILHQVDILHTEDIVASDEVPSQALRSGKNSSMRLA